MQLKQAKEYFEMGVITGFVASKDMKPGIYLLLINGKQGKYWTMKNALSKVKEYKSLEYVWSEVENITGGKVSSATFNF